MLQRLIRACVHCCVSGPDGLRNTFWQFQKDQRGGVAVIAGISFVPLVMVMVAGIEVNHWTTVKAEVQRTADLAALAGATEYLSTGDAQMSVNAAADLAELNDAAGGTTRTWNPTAQLLSDNQITAQITAGAPNSENKRFMVTVRQSVPLLFTGIMGSTAPVTINATGWAEAGGSVQPCVFAIASGGAGIKAQGSVSVNLTGCSMRSNASISAGGSAILSASAFYAGGAIPPNGIVVNPSGGPVVPNNGTIADPYASYTPVQNAISRIKPSGISAFDDQARNSQPPSPNTSWTSWDIKGTVRLNPGIYYVYGPISLGAQGSLTGTGVTIVTSNTISMTGGSTVTLSAAKPADAVNGAIPGVVFIGTSSESSTFGGNTRTTLTGVVYNPNGDLDFGGTSGGGSEGCLKVVAKSVIFHGNPSLASKCEAYGVKVFANETKTAVLIR